MAFPGKRELPKKSGLSTPEALEFREFQVRKILAYMDAKKTLDSLGLSLDHLMAFASLQESLGPDGLKRLAPLLRSAGPRSGGDIPALLALGLTADEVEAVRKIYTPLKSAGLSAEDAAAHVEAAAEMAKMGLPAAAIQGLTREVGRLRMAGVPVERVAGVLAAWAEQQAGAEGALVDAVRRQKEAEARLAAVERKIREREAEADSMERSADEAAAALVEVRRQIEALRQERNFLDAEVQGLGRARGAPWRESLGRVRKGLEGLEKGLEKGREALEGIRMEIERLHRERARAAAPPPEAAPAGEAKEIAPGTRYSRLMQRIQQAAIGPAPAPEAPASAPPVPLPIEVRVAEAAAGEALGGLAALKADADALLQRREALAVEVRKREAELKASDALWTLLAGQGDADLLTAAERLARAAREAPESGPEVSIPPEFAHRLREGARRLLQAEMVPEAKLREAEREVARLRERLDATVSRSRFESLLRETEDLRRRLGEAVPRWQVEAQEHELKFLKKVAFRKGA